MSKLVRWSIALVLLTGTLVFLSDGQVSAESQANDTSGVDLFVLIDQSLSMSGFRGQKPTDPNELRIDTAHYLVDYLGFDTLIHSERVNRISVIGFGSPASSHVVIPLTSLSATNVQQSDQVRQDLKNRIVAEKLGNTSVVSALDLVAQEIAHAEKLGDSRQAIIVLITDGTPYDARELSLKQYFAEIQQHYVGLQSQHDSFQWTLLVVGIDEQSSYWPLVEAEWQGTAKSAVRVEQSEAMKTEIVRLLSPELGYQGSIFGPGEIFVEPYLKWVSFSIFKYSGDLTTKLLYPDSNGELVALSPDDPQVISQIGERYELWVITNPAPGHWQIESQGVGQVDIFKQIQFSSVEMEFPNHTHPQHFPFYFRFMLRQADYLAAQYPLTFHVTLVEPNRDEVGIIIPCCKLTEAGTFEAISPYTPRQLGEYRVRVQVTTMTNSNNSPQEVAVSDREFSFSAYAATPSIESPKPPYQQYLPIPQITFSFVDRQGELIREDPSVAIDLSLCLQIPSDQGTTVSLQRIASGQYQATRPIVLPGDGPKGLDLVGYDEQGNEEFRHMLQIDTFRDARLVAPPVSVPVNGQMSSLAVELLDQSGIRLGPSVEYPLVLYATILPPQGNPIAEVLNYDPATSTFRTTHVLPTTTEGDYRIHIVAKSKIDGAEVTTFEDDLSYSATSNLPYYEIVSPSVTASDYLLHDGFHRTDMPIEIRWIQNRQPVDPRSVFLGDPSSLVVVDISGPGEISISGLLLRQISEQDRSLWGTTIPDLENEGVYTATFRFQDAKLLSQDPYMTFDDTVVSFSRTEAMLWRRLRFGAIGAFIILVGIALLWAGNEAYQRLVPPFPKGTVSVLEYESGHNLGTQLEQLNLYKRRRRTIVWQPKADKLTAMGLHKLVIQHRPGRAPGQPEGIDLQAFCKHTRGLGKLFGSREARLFGMTFDRGESEKRVPGTSGHSSSARSIFRIKYEPPLKTS